MAEWGSWASSGNVGGAFFTASGDNLTTVAGSNWAKASVSDNGDKCHEFNAPGDFTSFSVSSGNYPGMWYANSADYALSGGTGMWYKAGDQTNVSGVGFTGDNDGLDSVTADITAGGGFIPYPLDRRGARGGLKVLSGGLQ
jgi:hypothetical protein